MNVGVKAFICKNPKEQLEYKLVYPILLGDSEVWTFYTEDEEQAKRNLEGLRVSQLFVADGNAGSELTYIASQSQMKMHPTNTDHLPIFLTLPQNRADIKGNLLLEDSSKELWKQAQDSVYPMAVRLKFALTALDYFGRDYKDD